MAARPASPDTRALLAAERLLGEALAATAASRLICAGLWAAGLLPGDRRRAVYRDAAAAVGQARAALGNLERQLWVLAEEAEERVA